MPEGRRGNALTLQHSTHELCPFPHHEVRQLPPEHGKYSFARRGCSGNWPDRPQFSGRSGQRVLVHRSHIRRNARANPAGACAVSRRQFFPAHGAGWRRFSAVGLARFVFPRPDYGAFDRLSITALRDGTVDPRSGRNQLHTGAWPVDDRHHAGGADRRGVYGGIGHHAGVRRSRSDRSNGHRTVALPRCAASARAFFSHALPVHGVEHRGYFREQFDLQSLFQHRLHLLSRSGEGLLAHPRHHYRRFEEFSVRVAHWRDRLLPGTNGERRRRRGGQFDYFERRDRHYHGDRLRYPLQHRLHRFLPDVSTPSHLVELRDVQMQFEEKKVLDGFSLKVEPQERLVIMGQTGSGKSTILRLILGTLRPNGGSIFFKQFEITRLRRRKLQQVRRHIGMVYQYSALLSSRNVRDNVALPLEELTDKSRDEIDKIVDEKLDLVGMKDSKDLLPSELSGGMKKRVSLARSLVLEPELILLDEPSAGLDPVIASVIDELIIGLTEKSKVTSITVTHEMDSAFRIATRMAMLYQGKVIEEAEPEKFKQSKDPVVAQFLSGSTEGPILEGSLDAITKK